MQRLLVPIAGTQEGEVALAGVFPVLAAVKESGKFPNKAARRPLKPSARWGQRNWGWEQEPQASARLR